MSHLLTSMDERSYYDEFELYFRVFLLKAGQRKNAQGQSVSRYPDFYDFLHSMTEHESQAHLGQILLTSNNPKIVSIRKLLFEKLNLALASLERSLYDAKFKEEYRQKFNDLLRFYTIPNSS